jgi:Tol biopolymer transport system component/DNA-binding winged helix-turn-helix (wHTH) protein
MAISLNKFYEFSSFRVDVKEKLLLRNGERIPLTPKAFETLLILVERHGHIVEKNELMRMVWPDTTVEENNLNQNISAIRKALGENSQAQQFIETLPRRGYRFIGDVREFSDEAPIPAMAVASPIEQVEEKATEKAAVPLLPFPLPRWSRTPLFAFASLIVLTSIFYLSGAWPPPTSSLPLASNVKINRLPTTNNAWETAISPDGKLIAYVVGDVGNQCLRIRQIDTTTDTELVASEEGRFRGLTFSPDGKSLFYAQQEKNAPGHVLYQKPIQGGEAKRLLASVDSAVTFAPDGKRIAFIREALATGESALVMANADGSNERILSTHKAPQYFAVEGPCWSPDGRLIAVARGRTTPKFRFQIVTFEVETGKESPISEQKWAWAAKVAWLPDMSGLMLIGRSEEENLQNDQLWRLEYPGGQAHQVVPDLNTYRGLSIDKTGNALVTVRSETRSNLWVMPLDKSTPARMITSDSGSQPGGDGLTWTLDGRLVYTSLASGHKDLWIIRADGTQPQLLTTEPQDNVEAPSITADGQYVIFNSGRSGLPRVWRIGLDGKAPLELTQGSLDLHPVSSPVENFVYFSQDIAGRRTVSRVRTDGSKQPEPLTDKLTIYPSVSPDGKWVACLYQETPTSKQQVAILPATGGAPTQLLTLPHFQPTSVRWHPDGQALTYLKREDNGMNIWRQALTGGAPEKITDFQAERIFAYAWSRDGQRLACSRGTVHRDVVMISHFR